jgi:alpha-tubulin suppressor-like RCC1 family protein
MIMDALSRRPSPALALSLLLGSALATSGCSVETRQGEPTGESMVEAPPGSPEAAEAFVANKTSEVLCWGRLPGTDEIARAAPKPIKGLSAKRIAASSRAVCAVRSEGGVACWGENPQSTILPKGAAKIEEPTIVEGLDGAVDIGTNNVAQLGQAYQDAVPTPTRLSSIEGARAIAAARDATCVVLADRSVRCFGVDPTEDRSEGAGPYDFASVMRADDILMGGAIEAPEPSARQVGFIVCALTGRLPTCWGNNGASHLPTQNPGVLYDPSTLASMDGTKALAFGHEHACSLSEEGEVMCWGGRGRARALPTPIKGVSDAAAIAVGADEGCALLSDGTVTCWPLRDAKEASREGKRGAPRFSPAKVMGVRGVTAIAHGKRHACAVEARGGVICWGQGDGGALGRRAEGLAGAAPVAGIDDAVEVALGDVMSCARRRDGSVACWGKNDKGQLGDGSFEDRAAPGPVVDLDGVTSLRAGAEHMCALTKKGEVYCWGDNRMRVVAQGSPLVSRTPMTVALSPSAER